MFGTVAALGAFVLTGCLNSSSISPTAIAVTKVSAMRQMSTRVVRKLTAADGYLELGMPTQALAELDAIGDAGCLQPAVEFMTGQAMLDQHRYEDAIEPLQRAATTIPAPHNRDAWLTLGECFRQTGRDDLADVADLFADEPLVPADWNDGWPEGWESNGPTAETVDGFAFDEGWRVSIDSRSR